MIYLERRYFVNNKSLKRKPVGAMDI